MACNYYQIINYNSVEDGYYRYTGCTGIISVGTITPLNTEFVCAEDLIQESYSGPLSITNIGLCPSNTPTPTVTPTITPSVSLSATPTTQTPTPTNTTTPSVTPSAVYERNLRTGGWYQNVCQSVNLFANAANVKLFTTKPPRVQGWFFIVDKNQLLVIMYIFCHNYIFTIFATALSDTTAEVTNKNPI